ncbi:hepcidin-like [Centropristis striata]|uniref:hepcidin-like n=1 Tax=Centropristis striata TaxID=184440 RepID=UPI0027E12AF8|nr:hepcidin-like [Centropristis striata]
MKTFSVAVAAVAMLTFICIQESSAVPVTEVPELEETMSNDSLVSYEDESVETWMMPFDIREKRQTGPIKCRFCCGCCFVGVCGMCCK